MQREESSIAATTLSTSASISCPARPVRSRSVLVSLRSSAQSRPPSSSVSPTFREDAHAELLDKVRGEVTHEAATIIRESEQQVRAECHKTAQEILSLAIQLRCRPHRRYRYLRAHSSDDLKGRIIGREGRNIRTFEQVSGVNLVIDDTPETVVLSSFDPVRRETARAPREPDRRRPHSPSPHREMYQKASDLVQQRVREAGEQAAFDMGIHDLTPRSSRPSVPFAIAPPLARTCFSTLEVSDACGVMASELGLDVVTAKRRPAARLGKAIDHDVEGPHAVIGAELARRYGEARYRPRNRGSPC